MRSWATRWALVCATVLLLTGLPNSASADDGRHSPGRSDDGPSLTTGTAKIHGKAFATSPEPGATSDVNKRIVAWLLVQRDGLWVQETGAYVDPASGSYAFNSLPAGPYKIQFSDPTGRNLNRFYPDAESADAGSQVDVADGATVELVNATLPAAGRISGRIDGVPTPAVTQAIVYAMVPSSNGWVSATSTSPAADGTWMLGGLKPGSYRIRVSDGSAGTYAINHWPDSPVLAGAQALSVSAGQLVTSVNVTLHPAGHLSGLVTDGGGVGLATVKVQAWVEAPGNVWELCAVGRTSVSGTWDIGGLAAGNYRVYFFDTASLLAEYYDNVATLVAAITLSVQLGSTTGGINAAIYPGEVLRSATTPTLTTSQSNFANDVKAAPEESVVAAPSTTGSDPSAPSAASGAGLTEAQKFVLDLIDRPKILGKPKVGSKLSATPGFWTYPGSYRYQWYLGTKAIPRATGSKIKIKRSFKGKRLLVEVTSTYGSQTKKAQSGLSKPIK